MRARRRTNEGDSDTMMNAMMDPRAAFVGAIAVAFWASMAAGCASGAKAPASPSTRTPPAAAYGAASDERERSEAPKASVPPPSSPPSAESLRPSPAPAVSPAAAADKGDALDRSTRASGSSSAPGGPGLRRELDSAERQLESAGSNCETACKALGSLERAATRLCILEANSCDEARGRVSRARRRVRASCGSCADGTSVDPDAPLLTPGR